MLVFKVREGKDIDSFMEAVEDFLGPCGSEECICRLIPWAALRELRSSVGRILEFMNLRLSINTDDLKLILETVNRSNSWNEENGVVKEAFIRLHKEAYWHDIFQEWLDNLPDEDEQ